jgi:hypothetical protein
VKGRDSIAGKAKRPEGEPACPPEDCGGDWGYGDFLAAIENPDHDLHAETLEWVDSGFDPEGFESEAVQATKREGDVWQRISDPVIA